MSKSIATSTLLVQKYVKFERGCRWYFFVEDDLEKGGMMPITDRWHGENVGIWVTCHGSKDGRLFLGGEEVDPWMIRDTVIEYGWGREIPIMISCCYPHQVYETYRKELAKFNIVLFDTWIDQPVYAHYEKSSAAIWTEAEHDRMLHNRTM